MRARRHAPSPNDETPAIETPRSFCRSRRPITSRMHESLRQDFANRLAVGDLDRPALLGDVLLLGIDADRGAERGEDVGHIDLALGDFLAPLARLAVGLSPFDAAARKDAGPRGGEVVAAPLHVDR